MSLLLTEPAITRFQSIAPTPYFDSTLRLLNFCSQVDCFNSQFIQKILPYFSSNLSQQQSNAMLAFAINLSAKLELEQRNNVHLNSHVTDSIITPAQLESLALHYEQTPHSELIALESNAFQDSDNSREWSRPLLTLNSISAQLCDSQLLSCKEDISTGYGYLLTIHGQKTPGFFIDVVDVEASAGSGSYSNNYIGISKAFVSEYEYSQYLGHENPAHLKVLRIIGDSMERTLKSGQTCMVRLVDRFDQAGIYVFTYDGVTYIKRLTRCRDHYIASSINIKYEPFTIQEERLIIHAKLILSLEYKIL